MTIITTPTDSLTLEGENVTAKPLAIATVLVFMADPMGQRRPWATVHELVSSRLQRTR